MEDLELEVKELLEQVNYALSDRFKETWRHRFSTNFIKIFQERLFKSLKTSKPVKLSTLYSVYSKKHKYSKTEIDEFFECIDISLYYPLIYRD